MKKFDDVLRHYVNISLMSRSSICCCSLVILHLAPLVFGHHAEQVSAIQLYRLVVALIIDTSPLFDVIRMIVVWIAEFVEVNRFYYFTRLLSPLLEILDTHVVEDGQFEEVVCGRPEGRIIF